MTPPLPVRSLVPMAHVGSIPASIDFYRHLGLTVANTFTPPGETEPTWASLESDRARLMLARADEPIDRERQGILFYAYCDDVAGLREQLMAAGIEAGTIETPFYAPRGEFRVEDPDGYLVMITHT